MKHRTFASVLTLALTLCAAGAAKAAVFPGFHSHAANTTTPTPARQGKTVSFHLRNDATTSLTVQLGDQQLTVESGKTLSVKAQSGQQIVAVNDAGHATAGSVLGTVSTALQGNTLVVN